MAFLELVEYSACRSLGDTFRDFGSKNYVFSGELEGRVRLFIFICLGRKFRTGCRTEICNRMLPGSFSFLCHVCKSHRRLVLLLLIILGRGDGQRSYSANLFDVYVKI